MSLKEKYNLPKKGFSRELYRGFNLHEVVITVDSEGTIRLTVYDENGRVALDNEILQKPWLQDAQKEIEFQKARADVANEMVTSKQKRIDELKQKLQQLVEEIPSCINCEYYWGDWEESGHCGLSEQQHIDSTRCLKDKFLNALPKKLEGLLKEKEAK
jgi:hypothetical protein